METPPAQQTVRRDRLFGLTDSSGSDGCSERFFQVDELPRLAIRQSKDQERLASPQLRKPKKLAKTIA